MIKLLKKLSKIYTENDALALETTESHCLDLFATIGALRNTSEDNILERFLKAYEENPLLALKILFYTRDIRGGLGERRIFRTILKYLGNKEDKVIIKNLPLIPEFGRFDDLLVLLETESEKEVLLYIKSILEEDINSVDDTNISLLGKWLPSINTINDETKKRGKKIAKFLRMNEKKYRQTLTLLRSKIKIIENNLRTMDYTFNYENQPSQAMNKYKLAFIRNDKERYNKFLDEVRLGKAKINTRTLYPYEVIRPVLQSQKNLDANLIKSMDTAWRAFPNYTNNENALVVVDGSGSMYRNGDAINPISVAISLGIYFAERNTGAFKNHFITFSENPRLIEIKEKNIVENVKNIMKYNEIANTNLKNVFNLILNTARRNNLSQKDIPNTLYIITDMEFDQCTLENDATNFQYAKKSFEKFGYVLPKVVFWNVNSRNTHQPVTMNENGVVLVSGTSAKTFQMVSEGKTSPYEFMLDVLNQEQYDKITI